MSNSKTNSDIQKERLLKALEKNLGIVTKSCKEVDIARSTYYEYYNNDEAFKKAVDELSNVALDFVESALHNQIKEGVPSSTMFYLKTKGKNRGYIERTESVNTNTNTTVELSEEERKQMIKDLKDKL